MKPLPHKSMRAIAAILFAILTLALILHALVTGDLRYLSSYTLVTLLAAGAVAFGRIRRSTQELKAIARKHREDASRWEWRIASSLEARADQSRPTQAQASREKQTTPGIDPGAAKNLKPHAWKNHPDTQTLLHSGIFEPEYYASMARSYFARDVDAASHFLAIGMKKGISPTPLLDLAKLPKSVRDHYEAGNLAVLLRHLRGARTAVGVLSDHFDAKLLETTGRETQDHPGGALGWFMTTATPETFLPTSHAALRWGSFRKALTTASQNAQVSRDLSRPRASNEFDLAKSRAWEAQVAAIPLPSATSVPLVSIIMPTWNRSDVVLTAINSVQQQTLGDWELIVTDDGSTDETARVVQDAGQSDDRIKWIPGPHVGVSEARNRGLAHATGQYIAFLDSDNTWTPQFLELMLKGMIRDDLSAAYSAVALSDGTSTRYRAHEGGLDALMVLNHIDMNVLVISRATADATGGFDTSLRRWVDHDFAIRVAKHANPKLLPFIGCEYNDTQDVDRPRITTRESNHWQWRVLGNHWVSFDTLAEPCATDRISVVIPTWNDHVMTVRAVDAVLRNSGAHDVEVLVVDNGSDIRHASELAIRLAARRATTLLRLPRNLNFAIGSNYGLMHSTGEYVVFLNNDTEVQEGWLDGMLQRISDPEVAGVQPVLHYPDDTVQAAGTVFVAPRTLPVHFLASHPAEDAVGIGSARFRAITAAAMMLRASDARAIGGFDSIFVNGMEDVDLCLRLLERRGGYFAVAEGSKVYHMEGKTPGRGAAIPENRRLFLDRWRDSLTISDRELFEAHGFRIANIGSDAGFPPAPRPVWMRTGTSGARRWAIRYAAIGGPKGDRWGDTAYVESLASSLRRRGQQVVTFRHGANCETRALHDDVNLVIRGLDKVPAVPGAVNILWILSHPEDVTREELSSFDIVYAASIPWSEWATERFGVTVRPLLQATDATRFRLIDASDSPRPTTFVGSVHPGRRRAIVEDALMANVDFRVIGSGWDLPRSVHEADFVPNEELPSIYQNSRRVLADHWSSMASQGFIQNRIFDAVACGARVITDPVVGLHEVFGSAVQTYRGHAELRSLCGKASDGLFGTDEEIRRQALHVAEHHSFDRRAQELVQSVEELMTHMEVV